MNYKACFEKHYGKRVSDRTWHRVTTLMQSNQLELTKSNIQLVARMKLSARSYRISLDSYITYFSKVAPVDGVEFSPSKLRQLLIDLCGGEPHRTTIKRWLGERDSYSTVEVQEIILHALVYNLRRNSRVGTL
jgi:hypothetical protein